MESFDFQAVEKASKFMKFAAGMTRGVPLVKLYADAHPVLGIPMMADISRIPCYCWYDHPQYGT